MMIHIDLWNVSSPLCHQASSFKTLHHGLVRREAALPIRLVPRIPLVIETRATLSSTYTGIYCWKPLNIRRFEVRMEVGCGVGFVELGLVGGAQGVSDWPVRFLFAPEAVVDDGAVDEGDPET